jgi:hypothetical protein
MSKLAVCSLGRPPRIVVIDLAVPAGVAAKHFLISLD